MEDEKKVAPEEECAETPVAEEKPAKKCKGGKKEVGQNKKPRSQIGYAADLICTFAQLISDHDQHGVFQKIIVDRTEKLGNKQRHKPF